jgi:hypothetical protein
MKIMIKSYTYRIILLLILISLLVGVTTAEKASYRWTPGTDSRTGPTYDWDWYRDSHELELIQYYKCLHYLTGWNIPLIEFVEKVSPEDLATMPPEMYEHFRETQTPLFSVAKIQHGDDGTWLFDRNSHIWTSPEGYVYNGDRPPYQGLVWKGWEEYADQLPIAPIDAPFPAPSYAGIPKNTLPLAKIDLEEREQVYAAYSDRLMTIEEYYELIVPCPDAIYVDPNRFDNWDWTSELKSALSRIGLDANIANTRLGYEKSGDTITMVGMTPSQVMKEWTLTKSNVGWTCDTADDDELDDLLFVLEKIGAISGSASSSPVPVTNTDLKSRLSGRLDAASRSSAGTNTIIQEMLRSRTGTTSSAIITKPSGIEVPESETSTKPTDVTVDRQNWEERVSQFTAGKTSASTAESIAQAVQSSSTRSDIISQARAGR